MSLLFLLTCLPLAAAEPPQEPDFTEMSLEELGAIKVPNVYGASKHEQKVTDAPSAVSIVTADDIRRHGYRTLGAILRSVRGFYVDSDRAYDFIGVRGVNRPGDYGGRILITVDGHRLNDPLYDTATAGMDFILDVDLIERVEVIRGPGSSLYGNNAFFGVINVITRKGRGMDGVELSGSAASLDAYTGRASYGSQLPNGVEVMVSGTAYESAGNPRLFYPEFSSVNGGVAENMDDGRARSAYASVSWRDVSFASGYVKSRKTWPTAAYTVGDDVIVFNDPRFFSFDERAFTSLAFDRTFSDDSTFRALAYYDRYSFYGQYPYGYRDPEIPVTLNRDEVQSQSVGFEVQASRTYRGKHRIT
ncbi:MAG TPA: TonB-dependent receptor plug domain-containing protein, partial [Candidatus Eisenbacteria bacterium]|nr:TonB-dependent receptor plug domain-containing protein [Candidatus Eisenbacteria bacterium]